MPGEETRFRGRMGRKGDDGMRVQYNSILKMEFTRGKKFAISSSEVLRRTRLNISLPGKSVLVLLLVERDESRQSGHKPMFSRREIHNYKRVDVRQRHDSGVTV